MWMLSVLFVLCAFTLTAAQFIPFNVSNWTIPLPASLECNPNPQSDDGTADAPSLSWCQYDNPYILSDFLSRNSTDLTSQQFGSTAFDLRIFCDGVAVENTTAYFANVSSAASLHSLCAAIQSIQAGSAGILLSNGTIVSMVNYVVFADLGGQLLFVYFNNNTMANSLKLGIPNVENFVITNAQRVIGNSSSHDEPAVIQQDMVLLVTNATVAALVSVNGADGSLSKPCIIFSYTSMSYAGMKIVMATFFPKRANSSADIISAAWADTINYTLLLNQTYHGDVPAWAHMVHYYEFMAVPTTQSAVYGFINVCPRATPLGTQLYTRIYAVSPCTIDVLHNRLSNITLLVVYTQRGVTIHRVGYFGNISGEAGFTYYEFRIPMVVDWCAPRTVPNPHNNGEPQTYNRSKTTIYCVPDEDTVIDRVDMISPDTFTDIGPYGKDVWLVIALRNSTGTSLQVISLTELTFISDNQSTFDNPLGWPDNFTDPSFPCDMDRQVWYVDPLTGEGQCQERIRAHFDLPEDSPVTDVDTRVISWRSLVTTNTRGASDSYAVAMQMDHALIFVSQANTVSVFAMYSAPTNVSGSSSFGLVFQNYNTIRFLGNVTSVYVSENGMHLLTAVKRQFWELASQERYQAICTELAADPTNPFLQPFVPICEKAPALEINLNAFTQYASYCTFNLYCPSLDELDISLPESRHYADRPAVVKICPPGYFCFAGQKVPCPQGFFCDKEGMQAPRRCRVGANSNTTCADPQLQAPQPCPGGAVCTLPHIPGIAAPPGFEVPAAPSSRSAFVECTRGTWCPIGMQQQNATSAVQGLVCPPNAFCGLPSVIDPEPCECAVGTDSILTANGSLLVCDGRTLYCPAGSFDVALCPPGAYCTMPNSSVPCSASQYCPAGTFAPQLCPGGYTCPTPAERVVCPEGHYCPEGSTYATECNWMTACPAGSSAQSRSALVVVVLVGVIVFVLVGFCVFSRMQSAKQAKAAKAEVRYTEAGGQSAEAPTPSDRLLDHQGRGSNVLNRASATTLCIPTSRFQTPTIAFENMGLRLEVGEAKGKLVLDNVSGKIPPGSFVAVMGPSGSGKSTFMHTLAGKAFYGTRLGHVYINDDEVDLTRFSKIVGFVKQDDIMLRELTVAETLLFNARMRYDPESIDTPESIANAMTTALDLGHVRDTNIGDEKKRGISGGQRKRVNIGMELVSLPSILFLDEPTSGLDSSSSMAVCSALRDMAAVGITVISVIHQPRYEIFNMFHKVLLLAKGGKLVYYGPPQDALSYFETVLGITCPQHVNPPDFMMDVISGDGTQSGGLTVDDMVIKWLEYVAKSDNGSPMHVTTGSSFGHVRGVLLADAAAKKQIASFPVQLVHFTVRSLVQMSRDLVWFFTDLMLVFIAGFFLGLVFSDSKYEPPLPQQIVNKSLSAFGSAPPPSLVSFFSRPVDDPIISEASLSCMAIGMTGVTAALRVFGNEQLVYWREASAGMSTLAYFLAKNVTHFLFILLSPLLYLAPYMTFVSCRANIMSYYQVLVVIQFATTGLGYLVSTVVPGGLAQLAGVVVVLVFSMFGGARPTLPQIQNMFPALRAMPYLSYIRWGQEAMYLEEIKMWSRVVDVQPSLTLFDYHLDDSVRCMYITFLFGVAFRVLAFIAMSVMNRDQKH